MIHVVIANAQKDKRALVESASKRFNGCTVIDTLGGWYDDKTRKTVVERGVQISIAFADWDEVVTWAQVYANYLGEQCILVYDATREKIVFSKED